MADIFREVRERLDMDTVARHYGYQPNRAGFIHCPFHPGDRTASLKLYPGSRGWHCFGCNRGGSVIDFVALDLGLAPMDAVRRLNEDFSLGLPVDRPATAADRKAAAHRKAVSSTYQDFSAWRDSLCTRLNACFRVAHTALLSLEAPEDFDQLTPAQVLAIQNQAAVSFWADALGGSMEDQMAVFRNRKEVEQLCSRILNDTQRKSDTA